jgi:hypothetical protein
MVHLASIPVTDRSRPPKAARIACRTFPMVSACFIRGISARVFSTDKNGFIFHPLIQNPANEVHWQGLLLSLKANGGFQSLYVLTLFILPLEPISKAEVVLRNSQLNGWRVPIPPLPPRTPPHTCPGGRCQGGNGGHAPRRHLSFLFFRRFVSTETSVEQQVIDDLQPSSKEERCTEQQRDGE